MTYNGHTHTDPMKSTKVQNPWHIILCHIMPMRVRGNWPCLALYLYAWCSQFSLKPVNLSMLQHGLAASVGIFWARLNVVDSRWVPSTTSLCVKRRKLTTGKSDLLAYRLFHSCFAA